MERLDEEQRASTSRRDLERSPHFDDVSPEVGVLDEDAFDSALAEDADGALTLLAALTGATDEKLREAARRLAARVVLDVTRAGPARARRFLRAAPLSAACHRAREWRALRR